MAYSALSRYGESKLAQQYSIVFSDQGLSIKRILSSANATLAQAKYQKDTYKDNWQDIIKEFDDAAKNVNDFISSLKQYQTKLQSFLPDIREADLLYKSITYGVLVTYQDSLDSGTYTALEQWLKTSETSFDTTNVFNWALLVSQDVINIATYPTEIKKATDQIRKIYKPPPKKEDAKPKADSKTPPSPTPGEGNGGSGGGTTPPDGASESGETPAEGTSATEAEEEFKMRLRGIVDSDQCKISRMYNYFEDRFFRRRYGTLSVYRNLSSGRPSGNFIIFDYIKPENKKSGINPSILSKIKPEFMHLWYANTNVINSFVKELNFFKVYRSSNQEGEFNGEIDRIVPIIFPDLNALGESDDAAIKEFSADYIGTDSFTAERDIEATLSISLQSIDSLFRQRDLSGTGITYTLADLIIQPDCFSKKAEISPSTPSAQVPETTQGTEVRTPWIPECYEIMVNFGHSLNSDPSSIPDWTDIRMSEINYDHAGAVEKLKTSMFLTLVDHSLDFQTDGKVQLTINYRGRLGANMRSSHLDVNAPSGQISDEQTNEIKQILDKGGLSFEGFTSGILSDANYGGASGIYMSGIGFAAVETKRALFGGNETGYRNVNDVGELYRRLESKKLQIAGIKSREKEVKACDEALSYLRKIGTKKFFRKVLKRLLDTERVEILRLSDAPKTKNYIQNPTTENLIESVNELTELMDKEIDFSAEATEATEEDTSKPVTTTTDQEARAIEGKVTQQTLNDEKDKVGESSDDANQADEKAVVKSEPKDIAFTYFFDILSAVIEVLILRDTTDMTSQLLRTFKILLTNMLMPDINAGFSSDKRTWKPFNIGATPVAISTLNNFIANAAEQGKEKYTLLAVIRDMINQLLADALGSECVDQYNSPTFIQKFIQLNDYSGDVSKIDRYAASGESVYDSGVQEGASYGGFVNGNNLAKSFTDYLSLNKIMTILKENKTFPRPNEMMVIAFENQIYKDVADGEFVNDNKNGIPHISFKQANGLVKSIQLSKTDQPFLREARYAENSGFSLTQLSNVYDIQIKMVGNNLCMLGGLIYFDPETLGNTIGSPKDPNTLSSLMGIGGLYIVTKIKHTVSTTYETTITARYVSRGAI